MSNVISLEESRKIEAEVDAKIEAERFAAMDAFELAYSRFLKAKARYYTPPPRWIGQRGDKYEACMTKGSRDYYARIAEMSSTPALVKYQIDRKFDLLYELLREDNPSCALKLAQSIQDDMGSLG